MNILKITDGKSSVVKVILEDLPEWFGRPEANEHYIESVEEHILFAAFDNAKVPVGFIAIKKHSDMVAEAYVLGVSRTWHRKGVGRQLFGYAENYLASEGFRYLTVKTLAPSAPDPNYAKTRKFYEAIGFIYLEIFPDLWDQDTPCLMMLKPLSPQ